MTDLTLYTHPQSRGRIAHWMMEELGESYETVWLDYGTSMKAPDYLAVNPMGKVPALRHGAVVVTESAAICAYVADAFPHHRLLPQTAAERAAYFRWLFFAAGPLEQAVVARTLGCRCRLGVAPWLASVVTLTRSTHWNRACAKGRSFAATASRRPMSTWAPA